VTSTYQLFAQSCFLADKSVPYHIATALLPLPALFAAHLSWPEPGFRIRIDLMQIRIRIQIQHFFSNCGSGFRIWIPDPDPDPRSGFRIWIPDPDPRSGSRVLMNKYLNKFTEKIVSKPKIYLSLGLHKGRRSYKRSLQSSKKNIHHFKT